MRYLYSYNSAVIFLSLIGRMGLVTNGSSKIFENLLYSDLNSGFVEPTLSRAKYPNAYTVLSKSAFLFLFTLLYTSFN